MIDEKKIEEAAENYAMRHGDVAPFIKRGFLEGATWAINEILKLIKGKLYE